MDNLKIILTESKKPNPDVNIMDSGMTGPTEVSITKPTNTEIKTVIKKRISNPPAVIHSGDFDTLVLSGGSVNAIVMLGSLQCIYDNNLHRKIHTYFGCSSGAICCYLLAIGYTPSEIIVQLCVNKLLEGIKNFDIVSMINGSGAISFSLINEQLEKMTIQKIGKLITLKDLYVILGKKLICTTHNMTKNRSEILSYETYPDMPCLIALRMSSNLPFIFEQFKYLGCYYIDGVISNNFPIDLADKSGDKILGLVLNNVDLNLKDNSNKLEYIYKLISIPIRQSTQHKINKCSQKCTIVSLKPSNIFCMNFNLDTNTKLNIFSDGFQQMKQYLETNLI